MMKLGKNFRRALALAVVAVMLIGTAVAASTTTKKMIEANYSGIKIVVDGIEVTTSTEPFISEGTTYLPVRAVGEALGKEVKWDGQNRIVYIGKVPGAAENWLTKMPPYQLQQAKIYDGTNPKETFDVAGVTRTTGMVFSTNWNQSFAIWNTNAEYSTMSFTVGHMEEGTNGIKMEVYLDGVFSAQYEFKYDAAPKTVSIPLKYAPNVKLVFTRSDTGDYPHGKWGVYDISFS